jgi:hypothetical protein
LIWYEIGDHTIGERFGALWSFPARLERCNGCLRRTTASRTRRSPDVRGFAKVHQA